MSKGEEMIYSKVLQVRNAIIKGMDIVDFQTFYCMIAEFYCKDNDIDIKDFINEVQSAIYEINNEFGKF